MRDWIIKMLGGFTKEEYEDSEKKLEKLIHDCEDFARKHLKSVSGLTCYGGGIISNGEIYEDICVVGSDVILSSLKYRRILVAPWAKNVGLFSIQSDYKVSHEDSDDCVIRVNTPKWPFSPSVKFGWGGKNYE